MGFPRQGDLQQICNEKGLDCSYWQDDKSSRESQAERPRLGGSGLCLEHKVPGVHGEYHAGHAFRATLNLLSCWTSLSGLDSIYFLALKGSTLEI